MGRILWQIRFPRLIAAVLAGSALSVSGVLIQTALANALAGPSIIGINAGAGLAVVLCMVCLAKSVFILPLAAFCGAFLAMLFVYGIACAVGLSRMTLVLSGVALSSLMNAGISTLTTIHPEIMGNLRDFQNGGFMGISMKQLLPATGLIVFALVLTWIFAGELDILSLGKDTASSLGLPVEVYRFLFLALASILTGAVVSFAGLISFVGLIIPHMSRLLLQGGTKRALLALSALLGANFLLLCDTVARTLFTPFELPVGILISYVGVPFFLWLLFGARRKRYD
ncbi:corrinoid ABC transporter permease [Clostridia bacterium]|nr:corrinoid ABC transporter permease [Clostridia bacterium]